MIVAKCRSKQGNDFLFAFPEEGVVLVPSYLTIEGEACVPWKNNSLAGRKVYMDGTEWYADEDGLPAVPYWLDAENRPERRPDADGHVFVGLLGFRSIHRSRWPWFV